MAYDQPGTPEREERGGVGRGSGKEFRGEEVRRGEDLRGGGRSKREVESLIASAMGPCAGIVCGAGEEALSLDLRG